jgi:hypothetical protein
MAGMIVACAGAHQARQPGRAKGLGRARGRLRRSRDTTSCPARWGRRPAAPLRSGAPRSQPETMAISTSTSSAIQNSGFMETPGPRGPAKVASAPPPRMRDKPLVPRRATAVTRVVSPSQGAAVVPISLHSTACPGVARSAHSAVWGSIAVLSSSAEKAHWNFGGRGARPRFRWDSCPPAKSACALPSGCGTSA